MKLNPKHILGMLKNFGLDINTMLPQLESLLINYTKTLQEEAGAPLFGIITMNESGEHLDFGLYKTDLNVEGGLTLWKSFKFSELISKLQNLQNDDTNIEIIAITEPATEPTATAGTATAGAAAAEPTATTAGTATEPEPAG